MRLCHSIALENVELHLFPFIKEQSLFIRVNRIFNNVFQISITHETSSIFSSHHKNWFAARCEYLHLIKRNSHQANKHCGFFLIRCKHSQRAANQFLRWLEKRLKAIYVKFINNSLLIIPLNWNQITSIKKTTTFIENSLRWIDIQY